jgi:hypothetical protein
MANRGVTPGQAESEPIESRRAPLPESDPATEIADSAGAESPVDLPELGELSPEAARPSPLDEIAEIERERAPRD